MKHLSAILATFLGLILPISASADVYEQFRNLCVASGGNFKAGATAYIVSDGQQSARPEVARCAIETGIEKYIDAKAKGSGPYRTFDAQTVANFEAACPSKNLAISAISGLTGSIGTLLLTPTSNIDAHAYTVFVCH